MAGKRNRRPPRATERTESPQSHEPHQPRLLELLSEIERVRATPLIELMESEEERAHARELTRQAGLCPAIGRFRTLLGFVGEGRRATQAGKLTPGDAIELAGLLGVTLSERLEVRSMEDLPAVPRLFHWAVAAELLAVRRKRIVPGEWAEDLQRDPLAFWFRATTALLERGLLDGFRRGWRKQYIEFVDSGVPYILSAVLHAGGEVPVAAIEELVWEQVAGAYGYQLDDAGERRHVDRLVAAMYAELADLGAAERDENDVRLTELGGALALAASALIDDEPVEESGSERPGVVSGASRRPDLPPDHLVAQLVGLLDDFSLDDAAGLELLAGTLLVPISMPEVPDAARRVVVDAIEARADPIAAGVLAALAVLAPSRVAAHAHEAATRLREQGLLPPFADDVGTLAVDVAAVGFDGDAEILVATLARPNHSARQVLVLAIHAGTEALTECILTPPLARSKAEGMLRDPTGDNSVSSMLPFAAPHVRLRLSQAAECARRLDVALDSHIAPILPIVSRALTGDPNGIDWPETLDPWDEDDDASSDRVGVEDSPPNHGPNRPRGESADRRRAKRKQQRSARKRSR